MARPKTTYTHAHTHTQTHKHIWHHPLYMPLHHHHPHHHYIVGLSPQISSIEEADAKMEELAKAGKIDPAFLQISAKAYGAARDTNMTLEEAK